MFWAMNLLICERLKSELVLFNGKVKSMTGLKMNSIYFDLQITHIYGTTNPAPLKIKFRNTNLN